MAGFLHDHHLRLRARFFSSLNRFFFMNRKCEVEVAEIRGFIATTPRKHYETSWATKCKPKKAITLAVYRID